MKLFSLFHKESNENVPKVEYYYRKNYGGIIFTIRSDVSFFEDVYKILDSAYDELKLFGDAGLVAEKVLKALSLKSEIQSVEINVEGKECEIKFSSNPNEFING